MRPLVLLLGLFAIMPVTGVGADAESSTDERTAAYREFRSRFDAGEFQAALPAASRVVELTLARSGAESPDMANPLTNLATTFYRLGDFGRALDTYRRAVDVLDLQSDRTDQRLVRPLHGAGAALLRLDRGAEAVAPLKRAIDIIRHRDGLRTSTQLPVLGALIEGYAAAGLFEEADREHVNAYNVTEATWGRNDLRLADQLMSYARLKEQMGQYTAARLLYIRTVQLWDVARPGDTGAIPALRGVTRNLRMAYVHGSTQGIESEVPSVLPITSSEWLAMPSSDGERTLQNALQRLDAQAEPDLALRGAVLVDLGDWYLTAKAGARAIAAWREAWAALAEAGDTSLLSEPSPVIYRAPQIAVSRREEDPEIHVVREIQVRIGIGADGSVLDASIANPDPEHEAEERAVMSAVRRAVWRPAFSAGQPVAAGEHVFREKVYVKLPRASD